MDGVSISCFINVQNPVSYNIFLAFRYVDDGFPVPDIFFEKTWPGYVLTTGQAHLQGHRNTFKSILGIFFVRVAAAAHSKTGLDRCDGVCPNNLPSPKLT